MSLSTCPRRPGGRHAAPCHSWHAESLDYLTVGVVRLLVGLPPAIPLTAPGAPGRHSGELHATPTPGLLGLAA